MRTLIAAFALLVFPPAHAHGDAAIAWDSPTPWVYGLIAIAAALYVRGLRNLWSSARPGHGVTRGAAAAFVGGLALLALLISEAVERTTTASFAAHMAQHELLMLLVAPMLVLGRPLATWTWAFPAPARPALGHAFAHPAWRVPWAAFTSPLGATGVQVALLVAWHLPAAFDGAASNPWVHALQHTCFLAPALAFWWSVIEARQRRNIGTAVAALFVTMVATGALGALLTFAPLPWYATGLPAADALADQQLGGLLMWVPGGIAYLLAALWLMAGWLSRTGRHPAEAIATRP